MRLIHATIATGSLLTIVFAGLVLEFKGQLQKEIRRKIIERDAAVLQPVVQQQLADLSEPSMDLSAPRASQVAALLKTAQQKNMFAVAIFDSTGRLLQAVPFSLLFPDLPLNDFMELQERRPLSRFHPTFELDRYFVGIAPDRRRTPVLEVLLPLQRDDASVPIGFVQYLIDGRALSVEMANIDNRIGQQTALTLTLGTASISGVLALAYVLLRRAQRVIDERNERLARANFDLTLAAKASALGQITSHLIHGLQGPIAGLRAVVAEAQREGGSPPGWETAADYTNRLQNIIQDTVGLLSDAGTGTTYEINASEVCDIIRARVAPAAAKKGVGVLFANDGDAAVDNHRGSIVCLVATNLIHNAIDATPCGQSVHVRLKSSAARFELEVADPGEGIPLSIREHLFEPGRSGRQGGSGLGLAISQLLARQIGATLTLAATGPEGTCFRLEGPLH